jgi:hypothetical protein
VIVEVHNGNELRQCGNTADVITMPVCYDAVIDLLEMGNLQSHVSDAARITIAGKATIDQQRFTRWRDNQCCSPTFDINEVDIECLRSGR